MILDVAARRRSEVGAEAPASLGVGTFTTYDGSGVAVHASILDMGREWHGCRWWQANTPFPGDDERLENPCIWGSNDRHNWTVPSGLVNPLVKAPVSPGYNSDTELVFDRANGRLVCYFREVDSGTRLKAFTSTNGNSWHLASTITVPSYTGDVSPSISIDPATGLWRMYTFASPNLKLRTATDILGPWSEPTTVPVTGGGTDKWHGAVVPYKGRWIGVFSGAPNGRKAYPIASHDDGMSFTAGEFPSTITAYRPTMQPSPVHDWIDLWIGTTKPWHLSRHDSIWLDIT